MPTPAAPVTTPITPVANPALNAIPGESIQDYEARLGKVNQSAGDTGQGTGFGTPAPISLPSDNSPVTDLSSAEDKVAKTLGYGSYQDAVSSLTAPSDDTTSFYNDAFTNAGLDKLQQQITSRQNDLNTATGNINDNPWLDEASRVGRVKNLTDMATADIKNWQDEYNTGLKQVNTLVSQHQKELQTTAAANKTKLTTLENQAKALAAQAATTAKTDAAAPKTIKGADGSTYKWDDTSKSFVQILGPKTTTGGAKAPVPAASPTGTGAQFNSFNFTAKQLGTLNGMGLNQNDANGILQDIKSGQTLENIRQQMTAAGIDPKLLDTIMLYVDPAHNTPAPTTKTTSSASSGRTL